MDLLNKKDRCLIIAEAGVNHNGDLNIAYKLCDAAREAGADVVKFQTWDTDLLITKNVGMADYQEANTGKSKSQYDMLKELELPYDAFRKIKEYCDKIGIVFASTADEAQSLDFLLSIGIPFIKIGSGDIGNIPYLRYMGAKGFPIILSTGMSSLADIDLSLASLRDGGAKDITLLHCTTNYPCPYNEVNLRAMLTLRDKYSLPIGYSDHTMGTEIAVSAVAMGATVIEKHFTLDKKMEGPDHIASTEPSEFHEMVRQIRNIEKALGDGIKQPTTSEVEIKKVVTKRIVASRPISAGEILTEDNICIKRNDAGEPACMWDNIIGRKANHYYSIYEGISL